MIRYRFDHATVEITANRVRTVFDDGNTCDGVPTYTAEQEARAVALGYGAGRGNVRRMHVEHELLHTLLAEAAGLTYSPSLRCSIDGPPPRGVIPMEERVVFLLQRCLNVRRQLLDERREP